MKVFKSIEDFNLTNDPVVLTIGNFDGMHRGHQALLSRVIGCAEQVGGTSAVLTFSNHPTEVLYPKAPIPLICQLEHKILLLQQSGIDHLILLSFTREFSEQDPKTFLINLKEKIPFTQLILGYDAKLGKNKKGDPKYIQELANELAFSVEYFPEQRYKEKTISSSRIRECIIEGDFVAASELLGREYSILGTIIHGNGKGALFGYPTANIDVSKLCLPPYGVYAVEIGFDGKQFFGIANLGVAPTVRESASPVLEIFFFESQGDLYGQQVEVFFKKFIRPEKEFPSSDALKLQIAKDIEVAKLFT